MESREAFLAGQVSELGCEKWIGMGQMDEGISRSYKVQERSYALPKE